MFETVAPARYAKPSRKALYEALPLSIAVHALAGFSALMANVWTVAFPSQSPPQSVAFAIAEPPPPPPPPPPPAPPKSQPDVKVIEKTLPIVAPTIIPDLIPVVPPKPLVAEAPAAVPEGVEGGVEGGVVGGVVNGELGGQVGGQIGGVPGSVVTDRVMIERDKPLPMFPLSQVYPSYPEDARMRAWEDALVVRYLIGKDGRVKEVSIIQAPQHDIFVDGTLRAIRSWRFRPLIKDGQKQEVQHELTVFYRLNV